MMKKNLVLLYNFGSYFFPFSKVNRSCEEDLEEELHYFAAKKQVWGLGPFGPTLKNRHTFLFKSGTVRKPIKN